MNKIKIGLVAFCLAFAGVASAALVSYISNAPTATVAVSSPVEMSICDGDVSSTICDSDSLTLASTGGSDFTFTTIAKNNANNRIGGYYVMVIEATDDGDVVTGKEFSSIDYTINEEYIGENGELISMGKLCVVRGDGSLTKLADIANGTNGESKWSNKKMILFYDYDAISSEPDGNLPACNPLVINDAGNLNETRSFTHLNEKGNPNISIRARTFTPTWHIGAKGNFTISSQYVNDLATYANEVYFPVTTP